MNVVDVARHVEGAITYFVVSNLDPRFHETMRHQYYTAQDGAFRKGFPSDAPYLDRCYRSFVRHIEEVILQLADAHPIPWDDALDAVLARIAGHDIDWWLCGSAALAVRGVDITPHDIDLVTDPAGALQLRDLLRDELFEPVVETRDWICTHFGRAFLHATIDIAGGVVPNVDDPEPTDFGPYAARHLEPVTWRGQPLRVPPLSLQLRQSERRGLTERVRKIRAVL